MNIPPSIRLLAPVALISLTGSLIPNISHAAESLAQLYKRVHIKKISDGIKVGDRNVFTSLPAKGYKDGLTGIMKKFDVYPNPEYSFANCTITEKIVGRNSAPGCAVSVRLARKTPDGKYRDIGIRIEYAIGPGERKFVPNNSAQAQHAVSGNGWLEAQLAR